MNETERKFKEKSTMSRKFTIPMLFWDEWEQDCKSNFNNTYHLKMQFDHEFRKQFKHVSNLLMADMMELRDRVFELEAKLEDIYVRDSKDTQEDKKSSDADSKEPSNRRVAFGSKL